MSSVEIRENSVVLLCSIHYIIVNVRGNPKIQIKEDKIMSEQVETTQPEFTTIGAFVDYLKEQLTAEPTLAVNAQYVVDKLEEIVSQPARGNVRRGQLAGLSLTEMTDEQLKREIINANSVLYKAQKRGASEDTIAKNQARVDAANAEKAARPSFAKAEKAAPSEEAETTTEHPVENEL